MCIKQDKLENELEYMNGLFTTLKNGTEGHIFDLDDGIVNTVPKIDLASLGASVENGITILNNLDLILGQFFEVNNDGNYSFNNSLKNYGSLPLVKFPISSLIRKNQYRVGFDDYDNHEATTIFMKSKAVLVRAVRESDNTYTGSYLYIREGNHILRFHSDDFGTPYYAGYTSLTTESLEDKSNLVEKYIGVEGDKTYDADGIAITIVPFTTLDNLSSTKLVIGIPLTPEYNYYDISDLYNDSSYPDYLEITALDVDPTLDRVNYMQLYRDCFTRYKKSDSRINLHVRASTGRFKLNPIYDYAYKDGQGIEKTAYLYFNNTAPTTNNNIEVSIVTDPASGDETQNTDIEFGRVAVLTYKFDTSINNIATVEISSIAMTSITVEYDLLEDEIEIEVLPTGIRIVKNNTVCSPTLSLSIPTEFYLTLLNEHERNFYPLSSSTNDEFIEMCNFSNRTLSAFYYDFSKLKILQGYDFVTNPNIKADGTLYRTDSSFIYNGKAINSGDYMRFYDNKNKVIIHRQ